MAREIRDMIVVISGASAGIGKGLALELARRGAKLALCARRMEKLQELESSLPGRGHLIFRADVSQPDQCEAFIAATRERFGRIDTLVCNAGYGLYRLAADFGSEQ